MSSPVFSHALLFDSVFCYAGRAGKSRKHGATSQDGLGKSRKDWATPLMVFAMLGAPGKSRKGWWAPCWAPRVVATFQHWGESGKVALGGQQASWSRLAAILPESKLVAPQHTFQRSPAYPAQSLPAVASVLVNTLDRQNIHIVHTLQVDIGHTNILSKALHRLSYLSCLSCPVAAHCAHTHTHNAHSAHTHRHTLHRHNIHRHIQTYFPTLSRLGCCLSCPVTAHCVVH